MSSTSHDFERDSDYKELKLPEYSPQIPSHLLAGLSPEMQHLFEQQSMQSQYLKWTCEAMVDTNKQVRKTNGRLKKVENWKEKLTSFGAIILAAIVILSSLLSLIVKIFELIPFK